MTNGRTTITLIGKEWPVALPNFADREDLALAHHTHKASGPRRMRILCAMLGLCTGAPVGADGRPLRGGKPIQALAGASYADAQCNPLIYGGVVYSYLRELRVSVKAIAAALVPLVGIVEDGLFVASEAELEAETDFSAPTAAPPTV